MSEEELPPELRYAREDTDEPRRRGARGPMFVAIALLVALALAAGSVALPLLGGE